MSSSNEIIGFPAVRRTQPITQANIPSTTRVQLLQCLHGISNNNISVVFQELFVSKCDKKSATQKWLVENVNKEQLKKWDDPTKDLI